MSNSNFQIGLYKLINEDYLLSFSLSVALKSTLSRRSISELVPTLIFDTRAVDLSQTNCTLNLSLDCQCNRSATTGHSAEWLYCFSQYFKVWTRMITYFFSTANLIVLAIFQLSGCFCLSKYQSIKVSSSFNIPTTHQWKHSN